MGYIPNFVYVCSGVCGVYGFAWLFKDYFGGKEIQFTQDKISSDGKVAIVTGSNTGIGKHTAWHLARHGVKVYMACRDLKKCEETREEIVLDTQNKYVYCRPCDLASLESIRGFVDVFNKEQEQLHILINNAGVMRTPKGSKTKEGFEMQLGVNHLGHFLLTNLLVDKLKASAPSRVVNISSIAHNRGKINKEDLNGDNKYDGIGAYSQSKLANVLFTRELSKRLAGTGVTVNAVHPGIVDTDIMRHMSFFNSWIATFIVKPFMWPFTKTARQGAMTPIFVALDPSLNNVTGKYFVNFKEAEVSEAAKDDATAHWLWLVSEKWTRLKS